MSFVIKEKLISEKIVYWNNYKRLQKALIYIENNLIDSDDSLIEINNIITGFK